MWLFDPDVDGLPRLEVVGARLRCLYSSVDRRRRPHADPIESDCLRALGR
jgi:hypothetical protein